MKAATTDTTTHHELLEIPRHARRITVDDHARWLATGKPPHADDADLVDLLEELGDVERRHRR